MGATVRKGCCQGNHKLSNTLLSHIHVMIVSGMRRKDTPECVECLEIGLGGSSGIQQQDSASSALHAVLSLGLEN